MAKCLRGCAAGVSWFDVDSRRRRMRCRCADFKFKVLELSVYPIHT